MATFAGDTLEPQRFNGFNRNGDTDAVVYNNSDVGVTIEATGGRFRGSTLYGDSYGNTMFAIEDLQGTVFSDVFEVGYNLSKGAPVTVADGTIFERHYFLHLTLDEGNDIVTITPGLPNEAFFDSAFLESGGFDSFDGAVILTGAGDDRIKGGRLADLIDAGTGDDKIEGGGGNDIISTGGGVDFAYGGAGNDTITANAFSDLGRTNIDGGAGRDVITLSSEFDVTDVILFKRVSDSRATATDSIQNFNAREDLIDLSDIDANGRRAGDGEFRLVRDFTGARGQLQFDFEPNGSFPRWRFTADMDGDRQADFGFTLISAIGLPKNSSLSALEDFLLL